MLVLTILCQFKPEVLIMGFTTDQAVIAVGAQFLQYISWNFIASGFIFTCSGLFQALGNTVPALFSSASRLITFALPALLLSRYPWFEMQHLWLLSVASAPVQTLISYLLLRREFARRVPLTAPSSPDSSVVLGQAAL